MTALTWRFCWCRSCCRTSASVPAFTFPLWVQPDWWQHCHHYLMTEKLSPYPPLQCTSDELHLDTDCLFDMVLCDPEFEGLFPNLSHSSAVEAVVKTMDVLHNAPAPQVQWNVGLGGAMPDSVIFTHSILLSISTSHKISYHKLNFPWYQPNYIFSSW